MESEVLIKSSGLLGSFVNIDDSPSLVGSVVSLPDLDWSSFLISASMYVKASVGLLEVAEVFILVGEDLPPA